MLTRLSSKGQLVIPKAVRKALGLQEGAAFRVQVVGNKIILDPVPPSPIAALYGRFPHVDFLTDLEEEHRQELRDEATPGA